MEDTTINTSVNEETVVEETTQEQERLFTAAEVQSFVDKRVTQALATQQRKFDKQLSLSKLDDNERAKAEKDNRIAELEEQLAQFQIEKNKSELKSVLGARGLSPEFADILLITDDIEASQAVIEKLDKLHKAAVKQEVEKRLANGNAPKANGASAAEITKEDAKKMSINERQALYDNNRELYNKLFN